MDVKIVFSINESEVDPEVTAMCIIQRYAYELSNNDLHSCDLLDDNNNPVGKVEIK